MNAIQTRSEVLFEKYTKADAADLLQSLPNLQDKTFESDWIDFKSGKTKTDDLKRILSKVIGAFANSEGGVIIWGVVAKKELATGVDAVSGIELVPDVYAFRSRLMELRHEACDPPVNNIEIKEVLARALIRKGSLSATYPKVQTNHIVQNILTGVSICEWVTLQENVTYQS